MGASFIRLTDPPKKRTHHLEFDLEADGLAFESGGAGRVGPADTGGASQRGAALDATHRAADDGRRTPHVGEQLTHLLSAIKQTQRYMDGSECFNYERQLRHALLHGRFFLFCMDLNSFFF